LSGPKVALTITSGKRGKLAPVSNKDAAPAPKKRGRFDDRAKARSELATVYASILGVEVIANDILEAMVASPAQGDEVQPQIMADGWQAAGVVTEV